MLIDLVYLIPFAIFRINYNKFGTSSQLILSLFADLLLTIILFFIYKDYLKEKFEDFKKNFNKYFDIGLKFWLIGLGIMYIANLVLHYLTPVKEAVNESNVQTLITESPFLALLLTTIFAPIIEEIIFRKSVKDFCNDNKWIFILVSSLIFGYLHVSSSKTLFDFLYIIPYGALGGAFAYILHETDNIYTTILMHLIHNGLLTLIAIFL